MLIDYINAAMHAAHYEYLEEEKEYYGEIPILKGLWATGQTLETCRDELKAALEDWIIFALKKNTELPAISGISLKNKAVIDA